jgi:hypothetical protein
MDSNGNKNQEWDKLLGEVAREVDSIIIGTDNLNEFRRQIIPFAKRWAQHINDDKNAETKRREHWEEVKRNPDWQDKKAGPPTKDWEWDRFYLFGFGIDIGPIYEMPARYAPVVMTSLEGYIKRNEEKSQMLTQRYGKPPVEFQDLQKIIAEQKQNLADIRSQFDKLPDKNAGWISTAVPLNRPVQGSWVQFLWFRYTDLSEEAVFGCWRPPLKQIQPNPLESLMPQDALGKLPRPVSWEQEYERYYVVLTSIHDNMLTGVQSISGDIWPKELAGSIWFRLTGGQPYGPDQTFIEAALVRVKYDLDFKAEAALNASRSKFGFRSKRNE